MIAPNPDYRTADDDLSFENTENRRFCCKPPTSIRRSARRISGTNWLVSAFLSRQQEVDMAREMEDSRRRFRELLLDFDFVMRDAIQHLQRVHAGDLPFDRTIQVAVSDRLEKHQIQGRLPAQPGYAGRPDRAESARLRRSGPRQVRNAAVGQSGANS